MSFLAALAEQRWDDHRYYHHSRINQSLHLLSALAFLAAYVLVFVDATYAVMLAWLVAMPSRQIGHFFFEPKDYDQANQATHEYKEAVKVGYNLQRKVVLMSIWVLSPLLLLWDDRLFGLLQPHRSWQELLHNVSVMWLTIGGGAILFRSLQLCLTRDVQTGVVWATKILTDPFHDVFLYHKAPLHVLRGERFDPITTPHGRAA